MCLESSLCGKRGMLYKRWKPFINDKTKAEAERTEPRNQWYRMKEMDFRRRLSEVVCKLPCGALTGNCFCAERQGKTLINQRRCLLPSWINWTSYEVSLGNRRCWKQAITKVLVKSVKEIWLLFTQHPGLSWQEGNMGFCTEQEKSVLHCKMKRKQLYRDGIKYWCQTKP